MPVACPECIQPASNFFSLSPRPWSTKERVRLLPQASFGSYLFAQVLRSAMNCGQTWVKNNNSKWTSLRFVQFTWVLLWEPWSPQAHCYTPRVSILARSRKYRGNYIGGPQPCFHPWHSGKRTLMDVYGPRVLQGPIGSPSAPLFSYHLRATVRILNCPNRNPS